MQAWPCGGLDYVRRVLVIKMMRAGRWEFLTSCVIISSQAVRQSADIPPAGTSPERKLRSFLGDVWKSLQCRNLLPWKWWWFEHQVMSRGKRESAEGWSGLLIVEVDREKLRWLNQHPAAAVIKWWLFGKHGYGLKKLSIHWSAKIAILGGRSVILLLSSWSDLHRVCLEAEGDGWEARQHGWLCDWSCCMNSQLLHTHVHFQIHTVLMSLPLQLKVKGSLQIAL